jgi:sulfate permease, SulP family
VAVAVPGRDDLADDTAAAGIDGHVEEAPSRTSVLLTGLLVGIVEVLLAISLGVLVFGGALADGQGVAIGAALFAGSVALLVVGLRSSLPGTMGSVQDVTAAVLAVVGAGITATLGPDDPRLVGTALVAVAVTSLLTGAALWLLGTARLGRIVRFLPYPVVGGFLAGTGWLLFVGGLGLLARRDVTWSELGRWMTAEVAGPVAAGVALAVVLVVVVRRGASGTSIPLLCLVAAVLVYVGAMIGPGLGAAEAAGWFLGPFPRGSLWPPDASLLTDIAPGAIVGQWAGIATVVVLGAVSLLLNASGIELAAEEDVDLDAELRAAGVANLVGGLGGGIPGFHALSLTALAIQAQARRRATALVACGVVVLTLVFSGEVVARIPRPVVGGLLVFLGLLFLLEWLVDARRRMRRADHAIVVLITVVIAGFGFLEGVAVGIVAAVVLFLVAYSRTDVVRHETTGRQQPSRVDRAPEQAAALAELAEAITIVELRGFLFFGTASGLLERLRPSLTASPDVPGLLVLDLRHVTGIDASAASTFQRVSQLADRGGVTVVLSGASSEVAQQVARSGAFAGRNVRSFPDLDRAVEWCEDRLLEARGLAVGPSTGLHDVLVAELGAPALAERLHAHLRTETHAAGATVLHREDHTRALVFLVSGVLDVEVTDADGARRRVRSLLPGTVVGEVGVYLEGTRSADVVASQDVLVARLAEEELAAVERDDPELATALHRMLARKLAARLSATLDTVRALEG